MTDSQGAAMVVNLYFSGMPFQQALDHVRFLRALQESR